MNSLGLGKSLVVLGAVIAGMGLLVILAGRIPFLGRLPGDILIKRERFVFYFPLATSLLVSVALTVLFRFIHRR